MSSALNVVQKFFPNVDTVVDANRNEIIEVTDKDASSKAVKGHSTCAMAVACKRKFNLDGVIISRSVAYLIKGKQARRFKLLQSVSREIVSFDRGGGFAPGKYELSKVTPSIALGARSGNRPRGDRGSKPKRKRHITTNVRTVLGGKKPDDE